MAKGDRKYARKKSGEGKNEGRGKREEEENRKRKRRGDRGREKKHGPTVEDLIDRLAAPAQYP